MKICDILEELEENEYYKKFELENPDAFFSVAFLILDLESKTEVIQLDFYLPKKNKIVAFEFPFGEPKIYNNVISVGKNGKTEPGNIEPMRPQIRNIKVDVDDLELRCKELIKENGSDIVPTKIIAILRDDLWNLTCMDSALGIVRIKLDAIREDIFKFEKGSLMDFMGIKRK